MLTAVTCPKPHRCSSRRVVGHAHNHTAAQAVVWYRTSYRASYRTNYPTGYRTSYRISYRTTGGDMPKTTPLLKPS